MRMNWPLNGHTLKYIEISDTNKIKNQKNAENHAEIPKISNELKLKHKMFHKMPK